MGIGKSIYSTLNAITSLYKYGTKGEFCITTQYSSQEAGFPSTFSPLPLSEYLTPEK